ncbi:MAG: AF1514 family protein [Candidatus Sedimenticola endophacoides]
MSQETPPRTPRCRLPDAPDYRGVEIVRLAPVPTPADYLAAMALANAEADRRLGEGCHMLLSWYDRDRDFESPQHASECHVNSAIPGYIDYALYRDARLKIDIEEGRFVFFYLPVDL